MLNISKKNCSQAKVEEYVFLSSTWVPASEAKISVYDHGMLYGDGVYEGLRSYTGTVFRERDLLIRLERSARCVGLRVPYSKSEISELIREGLSKNKLTDAYIRIIVTRGSGPIGPDPALCTNPNIIIIIKNVPPLHVFDDGGIRTALATVRRSAVDSATAQIKSLNYLTTVLGKLEANRLGVDDVLMMDQRGFIAEAPVANVFIVRDGTVATPSSSAGILEGITRKAVIEILSDNNIDVKETDITPYDLSISDEIFLTGTHAEIVPVKEYNGLGLDGMDGEITRFVFDKFTKLTRKNGGGI